MDKFTQIELQLKYERSAVSSSQKDLELAYEKHGRKSIQEQLYKVFKLTNFKIEEGKILEDTTIFELIGPFCGPRTHGEVDVYLGIVSPPDWVVIDSPSPTFRIIDGTFEECCKSLGNQTVPKTKFGSPTSQVLPKEYNFYSIFEVTHQVKVGPKLRQLEYQLQYIVARDFKRNDKAFPPATFSDYDEEEKRKAYKQFIGREVLSLVCFAGLIMPSRYNPNNYIANIIKDKDGIDNPCLYALLMSKRLMYFESQTITQRLEQLEERLAAERK